LGSQEGRGIPILLMVHKALFSTSYTLEVDGGLDGIRIRIDGPISAQWLTPPSFDLEAAKQHAFLWATHHFLEHGIGEEHVSLEHIVWELG